MQHFEKLVSNKCSDYEELLLPQVSIHKKGANFSSPFLACVLRGGAETGYFRARKKRLTWLEEKTKPKTNHQHNKQQDSTLWIMAS